MALDALWYGLAGGAQALGGMLQQRMAEQQKQKDREQEEKLWEQRELMREKLSPPKTRTLTKDDPDNPGHKIEVQQEWQPPTTLNQPGQWNDVSSVKVPVKWQKTTINPDSNSQQDAMVDPDNPKNVVPLGSPRPIWNPEEAKYHQQEIGMRQQQLDLERQKEAREAGKSAAPKEALMPYEHYTEEDADGNKTYYNFDRRTGHKMPITTPPASPENYVPGSPSMYAGVDPAYAAAQVSPLGQLNYSTPSKTGGAGSDMTSNPQPAQGADNNPHGKVVRTGTRNGVRVAQYEDGTILPL